MNEPIGVGILLATIVGGLLALAPRVSEWLVRSRARRLPAVLSVRMREEWLAELSALPGRVAQLAFAIALTLTRRHSFAMDDDRLSAGPARSPLTLASSGGSLSVVVLTTIGAAAIAYAASFLIAPMYRSHARVAVIPQRVPPRFVGPAVSLSLDERLRAVGPSVLSRKHLEEMILKFDLYKSDRGPVDDTAIEDVRKDIDLDVHPDGLSFEIAYVSPDPRIAMRMTERVTTLFIEASLRNREMVHRSAAEFLDAQVKDVRSRLLKQAHVTSSADPSEADVQALERENLRTTYRDLLIKKEQADLSMNLERRQIGEQFKLLDPARLPEAPVSPDRARLTLLGAVIGFCLSVAMMLAGLTKPFTRNRKALARP